MARDEKKCLARATSPDVSGGPWFGSNEPNACARKNLPDEGLRNGEFLALVRSAAPRQSTAALATNCVINQCPV
eukprot:CAMPEP_0176259400 /NCGR_PEP_ID=MMETSP0121_2-20121125/39053_1 /TAXON_ID=160619 /ORGANISM="Kryptoperidinium foliaceum, Strain CCMP 1326" /LENGTH=73 /DNA_ID=CAMNT_0017599289 /DNA_START=37 /DNA_END=259 /DNA_ORIENTATION=-